MKSSTLLLVGLFVSQTNSLLQASTWWDDYERGRLAAAAAKSDAIARFTLLTQKMIDAGFYLTTDPYDPSTASAFQGTPGGTSFR